jgi:hypothetical protein
MPFPTLASRKSSTGYIPPKAVDATKMTHAMTVRPTTTPITIQQYITCAIRSKGVELGTTASTVLSESSSPPSVATKPTSNVANIPRTTQLLYPEIDSATKGENGFPKHTLSYMDSQNLETYLLTFDSTGLYVSEPESLRPRGATIGSILTKRIASDQHKLNEDDHLWSKLSHKLTTHSSLKTRSKYFPYISFPFHLKQNELFSSSTTKKLSASTTKKSSKIYKTNEIKEKSKRGINFHETGSRNYQYSEGLTKLKTGQVTTEKNTVQTGENTARTEENTARTEGNTARTGENTTQWTGLEEEITMNPELKQPKTTVNEFMSDITRTEPLVQGSTDFEVETSSTQSVTITGESGLFMSCTKVIAIFSRRKRRSLSLFYYFLLQFLFQ